MMPRRPFKHWRLNRRYTGFSFGQMIAIYVLARAIRKGTEPDELRPWLDKTFGHRPGWLREDMLGSAEILARGFVLGGEGIRR